MQLKTLIKTRRNVETVLTWNWSFDLELGVLLRPTAFLQACSQTAARMLNTTIDEVIFVNEGNGAGIDAGKNRFHIKLVEH